MSPLAQSIPHKPEQLKQERERISCVDLLMVWWVDRGHQGQKQIRSRWEEKGSRRSDLTVEWRDRRRTCWELRARAVLGTAKRVELCGPNKLELRFI